VVVLLLLLVLLHHENQLKMLHNRNPLLTLLMMIKVLRVIKALLSVIRV